MKTYSVDFNQVIRYLFVILISLIPVSGCALANAQEYYLAFGPDQTELKPFVKTHKIQISVGDKSDQNLFSVQDPNQTNVAITLDLDKAAQLTVSDVVAQSDQCFGEKQPPLLASYQLAPTNKVTELEFRIKQPCTRRTVGIGHEVIIMVKVRTTDNQYYFAISQLKVEFPGDLYISH